MASVYTDRFAFVHVPKTGGTWITKALKGTIPDLQRIEGRSHGHFTWDEMPETFRFGFVREPASWYASNWTHKRTHEDYGDSPFDRILKASEGFPQFIESVTQEMPGYLSGLYRQFLGPPGAVEFVGRYERLQDDICKALYVSGETLDWDAEEYRVLCSAAPANTAKQPKPDLTDELREMIAFSEREAMLRFGY